MTKRDSIFHVLYYFIREVENTVEAIGYLDEVELQNVEAIINLLIIDKKYIANYFEAVKNILYTRFEEGQRENYDRVVALFNKASEKAGGGKDELSNRG